MGLVSDTYQPVSQLSEHSYRVVFIGECKSGKSTFMNALLSRDAVVKRLETSVDRSEDRERFLHEAQRLEQLKHSHIVHFAGHGIADDIPYLVRDYMPNGSLRDHLPKGKQLPLDTALDYIKQAAEGLAYLHSKGIVHRDVKPENMLLGNNGEILLADFGIASLGHPMENSLDETKCGIATNLLVLDACDSGAYPYTAPEQFQGYASQSSDQYALAVVVYEWLTGELPFRGTHNTDTLQAQSEVLQKTDMDYPDIPKLIMQVILKALAKEPSHRYASVAAFANALIAATKRKQKPIKTYQTEENNEYLEAKHKENTFYRAHQNIQLQENDTFPILTKCLAGLYVEQAFEYLPWLERNCLLLYTDAEFSQEDIAAILSLNKQKVNKYLVRASRLWLQAYYSLLEKELDITSSSKSSSHDDLARVKRLIQS